MNHFKKCICIWHSVFLYFNEKCHGCEFSGLIKFYVSLFRFFIVITFTHFYKKCVYEYLYSQSLNTYLKIFQVWTYQRFLLAVFSLPFSWCFFYGSYFLFVLIVECLSFYSYESRIADLHFWLQQHYHFNNGLSIKTF